MRGVCRWGARLAAARLAGVFGRYAPSRPEWLRLRRARSGMGIRSAGIVVPRLGCLGRLARPPLRYAPFGRAASALGLFVLFCRAGCLSFGGR